MLDGMQLVISFTKVIVTISTISLALFKIEQSSSIVAKGSRPFSFHDDTACGHMLGGQRYDPPPSPL